MQIVIALLIALLACTHAFLFPQPMSIKTGLVQVTDAQKTIPLKIKLDVGTTKESRINVSDMIVELSSRIANYVHPKMPGVDGPNPQLSSGVRTLHLIEEGAYIDMLGKKTVKTLNGCWEMVWREKSSFGSLICGFDIPEEYIRNEASLPKGRMYLSFPIWTKLGLKEAQETKERVMIRAKELVDEKMNELQKMEATGNPLKKALHFRNALAAMEKYTLLADIKAQEMVPSDSEVLPLQDDLLLSTKGLVFAKDRIFLQSTHDLLGMAYASPVSVPTV